MNKLLVTIDGNSLINRAYYAIQKPMITKDGLYTHAVYGFLNMLNKILKDYDPEYIVVAFDKKTPTFRHKEYDKYKAGRKKMPDELAMQMPLLKEILEAMNIKIFEIDGYEADDIIGTLAKSGEIAGLKPLIISGDKDELQLASETTKVIITKKGITDFEIYDAKAMHEKYGFSPTQFIDFKGLMGDQSDNIPGIPGVGEKTATNLLLQFGSIENMIANIDEIKNEKLRTKVEENVQLAMMSKRLATIFTEVPVEINFDEMKYEDPDFDTLLGLYIKLEFNSFINKMKNTTLKKKTAIKQEIENSSESIDFSSQNIANFDFSKIDKNMVTNTDDLEKVFSKLSDKLFIKVFSDNNHKGKVNIYGISLLSYDATSYYYFNISDNTEFVKKLVKKLSNEGIKIIGHNIKEDYYALLSYGFSDLISTGLSASDLFDGNKQEIFCSHFDTQLAQYLLSPERNNYSLKNMSIEYLKEELPDEKEFANSFGQIDLFATNDTAYHDYGLKWCLTVCYIINILKAKLKSENLLDIYENIEMPLIEALAVTEFYGVTVSKSELRRNGDSLTGKIAEITKKIYEHAGEEFNINSPKQLGPILFEKLGLSTGKKTKTWYSTGVEVLERIIDEHEIVPCILEYRMLTKLNSTYVLGLIPLISDDGRVHAHFRQTVTTTGRISCTEPNLQNIPIKQELGRTLRKAFTADNDDYILIGADYSQIELRILAHLSGDITLIEAFKNGDDIHTITASKVFDLELSEVTSVQRSRAKAVNFGVIYGMSEFGLATELNITRKEAKRYIDEYFNKYETIKNYLDGLVKDCKANGYVTTIKNRKRVIPEINASNYMVRQLGERLAMNTPIQGSAADIIKIAMINVYRALNKVKSHGKLILQVHDELVLCAPKNNVNELKSLLEENMSNAMELLVPLETSLNVGENWYELK